MTVPWPRPTVMALLALAAVVAPAAVAPAPLGAQEAGPTTELGLAVGALTPLADLARTAEGSSVGLSTSLAVDAGVARGLGGRWGLVLDGLWATGAPDVRTATENGSGVPGGGGTDDVETAGATYLAGTARLLYRLPALSGVVEPSFGLGAGLRHVEMDATEEFDAVSETDPVAVLSGAVRSRLSGTAALTVELRDMISWASVDGTDGGTEIQNDVLVLVGVSFRP